MILAICLQNIWWTSVNSTRSAKNPTRTKGFFQHPLQQINTTNSNATGRRNTAACQPRTAPTMTPVCVQSVFPFGAIWFGSLKAVAKPIPNPTILPRPIVRAIESVGANWICPRLSPSDHRTNSKDRSRKRRDTINTAISNQLIHGNVFFSKQTAIKIVRAARKKAWWAYAIMIGHLG